MKIRVTESQFQKILEGMTYDYTRNKDIPLNVSLNTSHTDKDNLDVDTRVFNSSQNILNGDGTVKYTKVTKPADGSIPRHPFPLKGKKSFNDKIQNINFTLNFLYKVLDWAEGGMKGQMNAGGSPYLNDFVNDKMNEIKAECREEGTIEDFQNIFCQWLEATISRYELQYNMYNNKFQRAMENPFGEKTPLYNKGKVPGTDVEFIALFEMEDFNFSDVIKNGKLRQNGYTDDKLGIKPDQREKDMQAQGRDRLKKINIGYDNGLTPDIANNFSLGAENMPSKDGSFNGSHFKKSYGYGDENYTSVTKFIDKSILTATMALKDVGYKPDVIVDAPSSSPFNKYYCINLSRKLGVPYVQDFFQRNIVNVQFDEQTISDLDAAGASEKDKKKIEATIINAKFKEILSMAVKPIDAFISENVSVFNAIPKIFHGRNGEYMSMEFVRSMIILDVCQALLDNIDNNVLDRDNVYRAITRQYVKGTLYNEFKGAGRNDIERNRQKNRLRGEIQKKIKTVISMGRWQQLLSEVDAILQQNSELIARGVRYTFNPNRFKITEIEKRFRNCIHNVYIISDKVLSKRGNSLQTQYQNANFLIFDEDINSGATLKLLIDVLGQKIDNGDDKIKCLVNAASLGGR